jgi:hypothetical protein
MAVIGVGTQISIASISESREKSSLRRTARFIARTLVAAKWLICLAGGSLHFAWSISSRRH